MGIFSNKVAKQSKQFKKKMNALSATEIETVEAEKARTIASEQARQNVFQSLGAPGTYGVPGTPGAPTGAPSTGDYFQTDTTTKSPLAEAQLKGGGRTKKWNEWESRAGILDPEKYGEDVRKSAMFRIQSQRTAEAEQLLNREGPMWDQLSNSTYGIISEGAATQWREDLRTIKNNSAKGGSARRTALAEAQQMHAQEQSNQMKVQQTWKANFVLFDVVRANADAVQKGNYDFMNNLPGIRAQYQETMSALAEMMGKIALPMSANMQKMGFQAVEAHPKTSAFQRVVGAIAGAAQGYMTGGGLAGAALGGVMGASAAGEQGGTAFGNEGGSAGAGPGAGGIFGSYSRGQAAGAGAGLLAKTGKSVYNRLFEKNENTGPVGPGLTQYGQ